jgi:hypothetical protein
LRRNAEAALKLVAEVRFVSEVQVVDDSFVGQTLSDEIASQAASDFADPATGSLIEASNEEPLELAQGNGAERGHRLWSKGGLDG